MVWSAIFMGIAMFCLSGTLQYFTQDISQQSQSNRTNQYSNQTKGNNYKPKPKFIIVATFVTYLSNEIGWWNKIKIIFSFISDFLQSATSSSNLTTISESYNNQTATSIGMYMILCKSVTSPFKDIEFFNYLIK